MLTLFWGTVLRQMYPAGENFTKFGRTLSAKRKAEISQHFAFDPPYKKKLIKKKVHLFVQRCCCCVSSLKVPNVHTD